MVRRYMRRNHGTETPNNLIFVDTEAYKVPNESASNRVSLRLRLWTATRLRFEGGNVSRRSEAAGFTADEFWRFVDGASDAKRCTWIFAHNAGFDITMLDFWRQLDNRRFTLEPKYKTDANGNATNQVSWRGKLCVGDKPFFICCRNGDKHYKIVDTTNYWMLTLSELGASIGLPKRLIPTEDSDNKYWFDYCRRDVEIIERAVVGLMQRWRKENCGVFQMTAGMLAMTNFQHTSKHLTPDGESVDIVSQPGELQNNMERRSYFGGRTQPFYVGVRTGKFYHIDINSLYPAVMALNDFPRRFVRTVIRPTASDLANYMRAYGAIADVFIDSRHEEFPVRVNGQQYFAVGKFWTTLAGPELQRAIETDSVRMVYACQLYSVAPLFNEWVQRWYRRKVEAKQKVPPDLADYHLAKMVLNSLSGKWAQKSKFWKDEPDKIALERWGEWSEYDEDTHRSAKMRGVGGFTQEFTTDREPNHSFPAISAFITSYGREYMRNIIGLCPNDSVFYMATDSLICDANAFDALAREGLISETELGSFKLERVADELEIVGCNHYRLDNIVTVAGLMGKAKIGKNGRYTAEIWERMPTIIASGPRSDVSVTTVPVIPEEPDYKGNVDEQGWWYPYRLSLDTDFTDRPKSGSYEFGEEWVKDRSKFLHQ